MNKPINSRDIVKTSKAISIGECQYFNDALFDDITDNKESNYFSPVWKQVLQTVQIQNLLDLGCGTGVFSSSLKSKIAGKLIGIDASAFALDKAKENGLDEIYRVEDFCSQKLPLEDKSVDFILCKDVFEHLLDPLYLLSEIGRVLTSEGYLLAHVPNHFPLKKRLKFLFTNNLDTFCFFPNSKAWNYPHIRFYTYENFLEFLAQENFRIVENYSGLWPILPMYRLWRHLPQSLIKNLVLKSPTQFTQGFTVLVKKIDD